MVGSGTSARCPTIIYRNDTEMLNKTVLQYAERLLKGPCSRQALSVKLIEVRLAVVRICKTEVQQGPTCLSRSGCCRV